MCYNERMTGSNRQHAGLTDGIGGATAQPGVAGAASQHQLLAELAHELSRPLAAALNYAELALQDPDLPDAARARLEMVVQEAERCGEVVRRFAELGRPARPYAQSVDLNEIVRQAAATAGLRAAGRRTRVSLTLDAALPRIAGDPWELEAIVRNLLENAVDAAAEATSGPWVTIKTETLPGVARLTVADNGPGIPAELRERIFEPFATTKQPEKGAGLGLSIARRIAHEHGGRIWAETVDGGGAALVVELPAAPSPASRAEADTELRPPGDDGDTRTEETAPQKRALVVDDDVSMRKLLVTYLTGMGYQAVEAGDGQEALAESLGAEYDVIICDVKMPGMDGAAYYRALWDRAPARAARVVFATGVLPTDESDGFLRTLPNPRLRKPFRLAALRQVLENGRRFPIAR